MAKPKVIPRKEVVCPAPGVVFEVGGREYKIREIHMSEPNRGQMWCEGRVPGNTMVEYIVFEYALQPTFDVFNRHTWFDEPRAYQDFKCRAY